MENFKFCNECANCKKADSYFEYWCIPNNTWAHELNKKFDCEKYEPEQKEVNNAEK